MGSTFEHDAIDLEALRRGSALRWGAVPEGVIPLTAAEPDFPVAPVITAAITDLVARGVLGYASSSGSASLRAAVASVLAEQHGLACPPERIVPTAGTAGGIWAVVRATCGPGDECIVLDPVDLLFSMAVEAAGATVVRCPMDPDGQLDLEALRARVTPRTRLLALCNPHNPLGTVATRERLEGLAATCLAHGVKLLADEVWSGIVYAPAEHRSVAALGPEIAAQTFTVVGPSKTFGMPGLRIGFVAAPDDAAAQALGRVALETGTAFALSPIAEVAAEAAYRSGWAWRDGFVAHLRDLRDLAVARLSAMPGIRCRRPQATYVLFPDITGTGMTSTEFTTFALEAARVAVVPGTAEWFGPGAAGHVRLSFATSRPMLEEALDRLERALAAR